MLIDWLYLTPGLLIELNPYINKVIVNCIAYKYVSLLFLVRIFSALTLTLIINIYDGQEAIN